MPHRTSSTRNDYERKINYNWPHYQSNPLIFPHKNAKNRTIVTLHLFCQIKCTVNQLKLLE